MTAQLPGGVPLLPYGRQWVDEEDIEAVVAVLRSDWLTGGPKVGEFECAVADFVGAREAVAFSSGTAALHGAMFALGIGPGDEVIVPPMTFAATANCVVYQGGTPVFADVEPDTLLLDPAAVERRITPRTRAIIAVDYAGQPCRYDDLQEVADRYGLALVADACHALGATYKGKPAGSLARLTVFSFHPVKHIATGEGGMVTTDDPDLAQKLRSFRNHGITTDHRQREATGSWFYEMVELGYNYRISDLQCALGISQLRKLPGWLERRRAIARRYDEAFAAMPEVRPLAARMDAGHAYHLYVVRLAPSRMSGERGQAFAALRAAGIGVNVHYIPVHLHPFYRRRFGAAPGLCPVAEAAYERIVSLPIFPRMCDEDVERVIRALWAATGAPAHPNMEVTKNHANPA
jgi:perosamine synthetase